jgi:hypothetical protein
VLSSPRDVICWRRHLPAGVVDRRSGAGGRDAPAGDGVVAPGATPPTPPRILRMPGAQGGAVGGDGIVLGRRCTRRRCWCRNAGPYRARSPVGTSVAGARGCGPYVPWVAPRESTVAGFFRSAYPVIASGDNTSPRIDGVGGALTGQPSSSAAGMVVVAATDGVPPRWTTAKYALGADRAAGPGNPAGRATVPVGACGCLKPCRRHAPC